MKKLEERIKNEGISIGSDRINVDGFVNHQIDTKFMDEIGQEFAKEFKGTKVDKILTVEASGIGIAVAAARYFNFAPVVFAKKAQPNTMVEDFYQAQAKSFTKGTTNMIRVAKKYIKEGENILIIDDFLAHGEASQAMVSIVEQGKAKVCGVGIVISKDFQGGKALLEQKGIKVVTLAAVKSLENGKIEFME